MNQKQDDQNKKADQTSGILDDSKQKENPDTRTSKLDDDQELM